MDKQTKDKDVALGEDGLSYFPCPWCGTMLPEGDLFCPVCGHEATEKPAKKKKKGRPLVPLAIVSAAVACLAVAFFLFPSLEKQALHAAKEYMECRLVLSGVVPNPGKEAYLDACRAVARYSYPSKQAYEDAGLDLFLVQAASYYDAVQDAWPKDRGLHEGLSAWLGDCRYEKAEKEEWMEGLAGWSEEDSAGWSHPCLVYVDIRQKDETNGEEAGYVMKLYMMKNEGAWHVANAVPVEE